MRWTTQERAVVLPNHHIPDALASFRKFHRDLVNGKIDLPFVLILHD